MTCSKFQNYCVCHECIPSLLSPCYSIIISILFTTLQAAVVPPDQLDPWDQEVLRETAEMLDDQDLLVQLDSQEPQVEWEIVDQLDQLVHVVTLVSMVTMVCQEHQDNQEHQDRLEHKDYQDNQDHQVMMEHQERSEEHTSELQSHSDLVCRLLLEKKNICKTFGDTVE